MSAELKILSLFCVDRNAFDRYNNHVLTTKNVERELKTLLHVIQEYYAKYDTQYINKEELRTFFKYLYPADRNQNMYYDLIDSMYNIDVNPELIQDLVNQSLEQHYAAEMLNVLVPVLEGNSVNVMDSIKEKLDAFTYKTGINFEEERLIPCDLSVRELIEQEIDNSGLSFPLPTLNATLGGAKRKHFGLVYAYVDTGKTSMGMFLASHFAQQIANRDDGENIVYAGNEESKGRLALRATCAITEMTREEIKNDPNKAEQERQERGFGKIKIMDGVNRLDEVRRICDQFKPRILFLDQATKIKPTRVYRSNKAMEDTQDLFNTYRELAKEYNTTVIGISQGNAEAEDRKWLKLSDIYGSKVAIQGELDWAIGIGRISEKQYEHIRYINIPKNKAFNGESAQFTLRFNHYLSKYEEV